MISLALTVMALARTFSGTQTVNHLIPPAPSVLAKEEALEDLIEQARDSKKSTDQSLALIKQYEEKRGGPTPATAQWKLFFYSMDKRWDDAFRESAKARAQGILSLGGWLTDPQYLEDLNKQPLFKSESTAYAELTRKHVNDFDFSKTGLWSAKSSVELRGETWELSGLALYNALSQYSKYRRPRQTGSWFVDTTTFAAKGKGEDHLKIDYYVYVPKKYNPAIRTPVLMWVKGGWANNPLPIPATADAYLWDCPLLPEAQARNYIVIMPLCYSAVRMEYPGNARLLSDIVSQVKQVLNVDDDRVYMSGHSNGGTSCYASACENPTPFSCFYPINGWPTAAQHFPNMSNRQIEAMDGRLDDVFSAEGKTFYQKLAIEAGANWTEHWIEKGGHSYNSFIRPYSTSIFDHMALTQRHALSGDKVWEADKNGPDRVDWLQVVDVNEVAARAEWHKEILTRKAIRTKEGVGVGDTFVQNEKSGRVDAHYDSNSFSLKTSRIGKVRLWIHPKMVDMSKPVVVTVNGKEVINKKIDYSKPIMMNNFINTFDRTLVWVNYIDVEVPVE